MKKLGKKKILLGLIILILMATIIACFFTTSNGDSEVVDGIRWYYEVVDGEAVNVRIIGGLSYNTQEIDGKIVTTVRSHTSNGWQELEKLVVPDTLGGYPVTSIAGRPGRLCCSIKYTKCMV